jgi:hypothetical protein
MRRPDFAGLSGRKASQTNNSAPQFAGPGIFHRIPRNPPPLAANTRFACISTSHRKQRSEVKKAQAPFPDAAADDGLLSFFAATFAPVKFERSPERLAETLLR